LRPVARKICRGSDKCICVVKWHQTSTLAVANQL
jgi:hypothetical protein